MAIHPITRFRASQEPPLTKAALSRLVGVTKTTVDRWENGVRKIDTDILPRVVEVTGIAARELRPDLAALFDGEAA